MKKPCQKKFPSIKKNQNPSFNTKVHLSVGGILYNSRDSSDLSQRFKVLWGFFKSPQPSKFLSNQLSKPYSSTYHFETMFFQSCWAYILKIMCTGIFYDLPQCRHMKKYVFQSVIWGESNSLLIHSGEWQGFNSTNSCSLLKVSNEQKKGAAQEHIGSPITSLSALHWRVSMKLVREECARDGHQLYHLGRKELILTGEKQSDRGLNEASLHPKWIIKKTGC